MVCWDLFFFKLNEVIDVRTYLSEARDRPDHPSQPKPSGKWNGPDKRSEDEEFAKRETNADRFARGMLPLPPVKRAVPNGNSKYFSLSK